MSATGLSITSTGTISAYGLTVGAGGISFGGSTFTSATVATTAATANNFYLTTTSDRRLKRDLAPVGDSLDKLRRLKSVYFYWTPEAQRGLSGIRSGSSSRGALLQPKPKTAASTSAAASDASSDGSTTTSADNFVDPFAAHTAPACFDSRRHIGFIAQDVQGVIPEAVSEMHGDRYLGIDYAAVVPVLAGALQEVDARVERHEASLQRLEERDSPLVKQLTERIQTLEATVEKLVALLGASAA
jgi:hypothetical protein